MHPHLTQRDVTMHKECKYATLCYMHHIQFVANIFFIHNISYVNMSRACINIILFTHRMLFNYQVITHKRSLIWDLNSTRQHPTSTLQTHIKINKKIFLFYYYYYYYFFWNSVSLSRPSCHAKGVVEHQAPRLHARSAVSCARLCDRPSVSEVRSCAQPSVSRTRPAGQSPPPPLA